MTLSLPPPHRAQARPVRQGGLPWSPRKLAGAGVGPLALALCAALLWHRVPPGFWEQVGAALGGVHWSSLALALPATALSFWAVGQYDGLMHRLLGTGVAPRAARSAGRRAIAVGQMVGFGTLTSALVRWRCLPQMGAVALGRFSVLVSLSFLAAWAVVTGAVGMIALGGAAAALGLAGLALGAIRWPLPSGLSTRGIDKPVLARLLLWTTLDTFFAAVVLWAFLPPGVAPGTVFAAYLVALGAGLISQSPGGLGPFELTLIWLLPGIEASAVVAAALCYRLVYQIGPGGLALISLLPAPRRNAAPSLRWQRRPNPGLSRAIAAHPDWGLTGQGAGLALRSGDRSGWLVRQAPGTLVGIGPRRGTAPPGLLRDLARAQGQTALLYKCTGREAAEARRAGWAVRAIASEAWLEPGSFTLSAPQHRQLRRKLRGADKAGVRISTGSSALPLAEMAALNRQWAAANGGERGFSMGRFCPLLLREQWVGLAWQDGALVGFVSFHVTSAGWGLDLMRHGDAAAPGTMHGLVFAGISAAARAGASRLSLAACPLLPPGQMWSGLRGQSAGLLQFKSSFGPRWCTAYAAAPSRGALVRGLASVGWAVHRPADLAIATCAGAVAEFAFDLDGPTCEALSDQKTGPSRP